MNVEKKFCCLFIDLFCRNNFFTVTFDQCNPHLTKILDLELLNGSVSGWISSYAPNAMCEHMHFQRCTS